MSKGEAQIVRMSQNCDVSVGKPFGRWLGGLAVLAALALSGCGHRDDLAVHLPRNVTFDDVAGFVTNADPGKLALARRLGDGPRTDKTGGLPGWETLDVATPPILGGLTALEGDAARRVNGFIPVAGPALAPAAPFYLMSAGQERERALLCLTQAIYYEAALEPDEGQAAVAQTVLNRVRHPSFPHSICGVIYQGSHIGPTCQFTFTCDGAMSRAPVPALWRRARAAAERAVNGYVMARIGSATAYHADYVFPRWGPTLIKIGQIGAHIFYRFPGPSGQPAALHERYEGGELRVSMKGPEPSLILVSDTRPLPDQYFYEVSSVERPHAPGPGDVVGGRRLPTKDDIARINAALLEMEKVKLTGTPETTP